MLAEALITLRHSISSFFRWVKQQSKPDVSPELREWIVNIVKVASPPVITKETLLYV